jgi:hypothetical protein
MQKYGLALLLILPVISHAETVQFADANMTTQDGVKGYNIGYTGVTNGKYAYGLSYSSASQDGLDAKATTVGFNYGFQSFDTGSILIGLGVVNVSGSSYTISTNLYDIEVDTSGSSGFAEIGYAKLSGEGLDYKVSLVTMDGETSIGASMRKAFEGSNWGWQLGIANDGDVTALSAGVSLTF